ncbi:leucine-rich repeat domain-containing protein, partial [uncultured Chryseobacterium sp.]
HITAVSPKIKGLKNIVSMNLAHNNIKDIPVEIKQLKNLKTLILTGNPIEKSTIEYIKTLLPETQIYF